MDYEKAFKYVLNDPRWFGKFALGSLFYLGSFLILPLFLVFGYQIRVVRNVARGDDDRLPEWSGFGELMASGFRVFLVFLLYYTPVFLIMGLGLALLVVTVVADLRGLMAATVLIIAIGEILAVLWSLVMAVIAPGIVVEFARTDSVVAALKVGRIVQFIKERPSPYLLVVLVAYGLNFLAALGWILLIVGIGATVFFSRLVVSHMEGQLYGLALKEGEAS